MQIYFLKEVWALLTPGVMLQAETVVLLSMKNRSKCGSPYGRHWCSKEEHSWSSSLADLYWTEMKCMSSPRDANVVHASSACEKREIWLNIKRNLKYLCIFRMNDLRASSTLSLYFSASVLNVCAAFSAWICWKRLEWNKACNMLSSLQLPPSAPPALAWQSHWTQSQCCQSVVVALFKNKQEISCV